MRNDVQRFISTCCELGAARFAVAAGMSSGEISTKKAIALYGVWFRDAVASGRLRPCRIGKGDSGKRWYSIQAILTLRAADEAPAEIISSYFNPKTI